VNLKKSKMTRTLKPRPSDDIRKANGFSKNDVRRYEALMLTFTNWEDQAWYDSTGGRPRTKNDSMQYLRNTPFWNKDGKRYFKSACYKPSQTKLLAHLVHNEKEHTLFFINQIRKNRILANWDIDPSGHISSAEGSRRSQALAELVESKYCFGRGLIDPSPSGSGRHVYQVFDVSHPTEWNKLMPANEIVETMREWERRVKAEPEIASFVGADLCCLRGDPTLWEWTSENGHQLVRRGSVVKAPYLLNFDEDILKLENLIPIKLADIQRHLRDHPETSPKRSLPPPIDPPSPPITYMGRTATPLDVKELRGREKKRACIKQMSVRLGRPVTSEEAMDEYEANWEPTGFTSTDRKRRRKQIEELCNFYAETFEKMTNSPYTFKPRKYIDLIVELVSVKEFDWERRERLNHHRLADFIGIKVQDAFYPKTNSKFVARATRNATIANTRALREKGLIDWIVTTNTYQKYLDIAVKYELLEVYDEFRKPYRTKQTGVALTVGAARMIGPGKALEQEYEAFNKLVMNSLPDKAGLT
jgi:hypothetical protein